MASIAEMHGQNETLTQHSARQTYREVLAGLAAKTLTKIPALNGRVEKACKMVLQGDVELHEDGTALVNSLTDPTRAYQVTGTPGQCQCKDYDHAPEHLCAHRLAVGFTRKVQELLPQEPIPPIGAANGCAVSQPPGQPAPAVLPAGIDPRHVVYLHGKQFIKYAGLLAMAHARGLESLTVDWSYNDAELSLAHAVAVFPFGTFAESADSTPQNVGKNVALHWRRLSLTRAKARALRDALGVDLVALEELGGEAA